MAQSSLLVCNEAKVLEKIVVYTLKIQDILTNPQFLSSGKHELLSKIILIGKSALRILFCRTKNYSKDVFSVSLELKDGDGIRIRDYESITLSSDVEEVACYLTIKDKNGLLKYPKWTFLEKDSTTVVDIISEHTLKSEAEMLLPGGCLTISCEVFYARMSKKISIGEGKVTVFCNEIEKLSEDFENLLSSNTTKFDVFFQVRGKSIGAHVNILSARSPVFTSMLENCASEPSNRRIEIEDMGSETFTYLLRYIYSGKLDVVKMKSAMLFAELYAAAIKYDVRGLKNICSNVILQSVSQDNIEDYFLLALKYNDKAMMDAVYDYIVEHHEIVDSDVWKKLIMKQPDFEHQAFREILRK